MQYLDICISWTVSNKCKVNYESCQLCGAKFIWTHKSQTTNLSCKFWITGNHTWKHMLRSESDHSSTVKTKSKEENAVCWVYTFSGQSQQMQDESRLLWILSSKTYMNSYIGTMGQMFHATFEAQFGTKLFSKIPITSKGILLFYSIK